jgi:hypothetical protein
MDENLSSNLLVRINDGFAGLQIQVTQYDYRISQHLRAVN